jgi:choline dehydrogenase
MRKYFTKLENNHHLIAGQEGHGYEGWLDTSYQPLDIVTNDPQLASVVTGATVALSNETNTVINLETLVAGDANEDSAKRDSTDAIYQIPLSTVEGKRTGSREFVVAVRDSKNDDGEKAYPLGEFLLYLCLERIYSNAGNRCQDQLPRYQDQLRRVYPSSTFFF